jgi:hypothetical protein
MDAGSSLGRVLLHHLEDQIPNRTKRRLPRDFSNSPRPAAWPSTRRTWCRLLLQPNLFRLAPIVDDPRIPYFDQAKANSLLSSNSEGEFMVGKLVVDSTFCTYIILRTYAVSPDKDP